MSEKVESKNALVVSDSDDDDDVDEDDESENDDESVPGAPSLSQPTGALLPAVPLTDELLEASKTKYRKRFRKFRKRVENLKSIVLLLCTSDIYDSGSLTPDDKVRHDIFIAELLCGLYWMFVRTYGKDPMNHEIFPEIARIKELSSRFEDVQARRKAAHIDKDAAKRMVKHSLWDLEEKNREKQEKANGTSHEPSNVGPQNRPKAQGPGGPLRRSQENRPHHNDKPYNQNKKRKKRFYK